MNSYLDTPIHVSMMFQWPTEGQDDHYKPQVAQHVTDAIASLDDDSARVTITLATIGERLDLN